MKMFARTTALAALLIGVSLGATGAGFAQDAMTPAPMASSAMAPDAMEKCHTDAMAEKDTSKQNQMLANCNAMAPGAMGADAMGTNHMAPDAMAPNAMAPNAMAPAK
ncbi:MAG TPA: hypothetical protein VGM83_01935 [Devosiaceae bacterium]|jgi:pentapeptide MXKDX repeat protein